ncbi:Hypothetical_protein [Hexamita inflata]|uniref:Hypothetical_protein n=1 Tax=Hexamita inflata TaxID=28002 RepID=A0AA86TT72_9EUKA|nr:Hypothetical protein HINF_LOCUS13545 [Hexamita inflata]CAI9925902.1 Hypothetical protein HINF_LOCUS13547 [Hexamita inflata]
MVLYRRPKSLYIVLVAFSALLNNHSDIPLIRHQISQSAINIKVFCSWRHPGYIFTYVINIIQLVHLAVRFKIQIMKLLVKPVGRSSLKHVIKSYCTCKYIGA